MKVRRSYFIFTVAPLFQFNNFYYVFISIPGKLKRKMKQLCPLFRGHIPTEELSLTFNKCTVMAKWHRDKCACPVMVPTRHLMGFLKGKGDCAANALKISFGRHKVRQSTARSRFTFDNIPGQLFLDFTRGWS